MLSDAFGVTVVVDYLLNKKEYRVKYYIKAK